MQPCLQKTLPLPFPSVVGTSLRVICPWGCHSCPQREKASAWDRGQQPHPSSLDIEPQEFIIPRLHTQHSVAPVGNSENQERSLPILGLSTHIAEWLWTLTVAFSRNVNTEAPLAPKDVVSFWDKRNASCHLGEEDDIKAWASQLYILWLEDLEIKSFSIGLDSPLAEGHITKLSMQHLKCSSVFQGGGRISIFYQYLLLSELLTVKGGKKKRWQLRRAGIASCFYDNSVCSAPKLHLVFSGLTAR